jgi:hypothetical protein
MVACEDKKKKKTPPLPEDILIDIFWKTVVESDISPLTRTEKKRVETGKKEFILRETARRKDLK